MAASAFFDAIDSLGQDKRHMTVHHDRGPLPAGPKKKELVRSAATERYSEMRSKYVFNFAGWKRYN